MESQNIVKEVLENPKPSTSKSNVTMEDVGMDSEADDNISIHNFDSQVHDSDEIPPVKPEIVYGPLDKIDPAYVNLLLHKIKVMEREKKQDKKIIKDQHETIEKWVYFVFKFVSY